MVKWHPYAMGLAAGEVALWLLFAGFFIFWIHYWTVTFDYMEAKLHRVSIVNVKTEATARLIGHCTTLFSSLLLLPASRTGLWVDVFAIPYERALKYHRILGSITFLSMTLHACTWWGKWWKEGNLGTNIFAYNFLWLSSERISYMDFSNPVAETAWALMGISLLMAVTLRRRLYDVFQYSHKYIGIMYFVSAIVHAWSFW